MRSTRTRETSARGEVINLRASQKQKALIDRAAETLGRSRSEFVLETACREAETVVLDRRYFVVPEAVFKEFTPCSTGRPRIIRGCGDCFRRSRRGRNDRRARKALSGA
jgi:uncharacterized protein (DUF1778 family)